MASRYLGMNLACLPENQSIECVPRALYEAWTCYGQSEAMVVMVVQPNERNLFDQRWVEYVLFQK
jgi:hypothetical protein